MIKEEKNNYLKQSKGITLVALVVTIVVLLILAGVSISLVLGNNGLISKTKDARNAYEQGAVNDETGMNNLYDEIASILGENPGGTGGLLPEDSTAYTTPYLPTGFSKVTGTSLATGLTIANTTNGTPGTQNYVWIEVPTTISASITRNGVATTVTLADAANDEEIAAILESYAGDYTKGSSTQDRGSWKEEWYDFYNTTWNGESEYAYIGLSTTSASTISSSYPFTKWDEYYEGEVYTADTNDVNNVNNEKVTKVDFESGATYSETNYYFTKVNENFKNHSDGCGLTYNEYQTAYSKMLQSIKKYGGFWLAQYEAGIAYEEDGQTATNRTSSSPRITNPTSANYAKDQYPYNYVYCSEAQKIANADSTSEYSSSLPFGIQWDLVCRFLEEKEAKKYAEIATSSNWGNYYGISCTSSSTSKYSTNSGSTFTLGSYKKSTSKSVLLTTGAIEKTTTSDNTHPMNIYDFAGNVWEWTLERASAETNIPCAGRGGNYFDNNYFYNPAADRNDYGTTDKAYGGIGFRSVLY